MARGLGGDDGPSVWMFAACILIWMKVKGWFDSGAAEFDKNHANIFQAETTAEIQRKTSAAKAVAFRSSRFPPGRKLSYYSKLADDQYKELSSNLNIDEDKLINALRVLNADELKAVFVSFGVRDLSNLNSLGLAMTTGNIFDFYDRLLSDSWAGGNDYSNMKSIWAKTGLWGTL